VSAVVVGRPQGVNTTCRSRAGGLGPADAIKLTAQARSRQAAEAARSQQAGGGRPPPPPPPAAGVAVVACYMYGSLGLTIKGAR
jgi:hypothetical protein